MCPSRCHSVLARVLVANSLSASTGTIVVKGMRKVEAEGM